MKKMFKSMLAAVLAFGMLLPVNIAVYASENEVVCSHVEISVSDGSVMASSFVRDYDSSSQNSVHLICAAYDRNGKLVSSANDYGMNKILAAKLEGMADAPEGGYIRAYVWDYKTNKPISNIAYYKNTLDNLGITVMLNGVRFNDFDINKTEYNYNLTAVTADGESKVNFPVITAASDKDNTFTYSVRNDYDKKISYLKIMAGKRGKEKINATPMSNIDVFGYDNAIEKVYTFNWENPDYQIDRASNLSELDFEAKKINNQNYLYYEAKPALNYYSDIDYNVPEGDVTEVKFNLNFSRTNGFTWIAIKPLNEDTDPDTLVADKNGNPLNFASSWKSNPGPSAGLDEQGRIIEPKVSNAGAVVFSGGKTGDGFIANKAMGIGNNSTGAIAVYNLYDTYPGTQLTTTYIPKDFENSLYIPSFDDANTVKDVTYTLKLTGPAKIAVWENGGFTLTDVTNNTARDAQALALDKAVVNSWRGNDTHGARALSAFTIAYLLETGKIADDEWFVGADGGNHLKWPAYARLKNSLISVLKSDLDSSYWAAKHPNATVEECRTAWADTSLTYVDNSTVITDYKYLLAGNSSYDYGDAPSVKKNFDTFADDITAIISNRNPHNQNGYGSVLSYNNVIDIEGEDYINCQWFLSTLPVNTNIHSFVANRDCEVLVIGGDPICPTGFTMIDTNNMPLIEMWEDPIQGMKNLAVKAVKKGETVTIDTGNSEKTLYSGLVVFARPVR